jgi:hypothetical protein
MRKLKQRAIPEGTAELVVRGSKFDNGNLSIKIVLPLSAIGNVIQYTFPLKSSKSRQYKKSNYAHQQ